MMGDLVVEDDSEEGAPVQPRFDLALSGKLGVVIAFIILDLIF